MSRAKSEGAARRGKSAFSDWNKTLAAADAEGISEKGAPPRGRSCGTSVRGRHGRRRPKIDGPEVKVPAGGKRWTAEPWPIYSTEFREEVRACMNNMLPGVEEACGWCNNMPFPKKMPNGVLCPIAALGECGDHKCPAFRPRHPEVRLAMEKIIVDMAVERLLPTGGIETYVSIGCGLLSQDWVVMEKLRAAGLYPERVVLIDLTYAESVLTCKGGDFFGDKTLDLREEHLTDLLGLGFSVTANVGVEDDGNGGNSCRIFDFCTDDDTDSIFVGTVAGSPDTLIFGIQYGDEENVLQVDGFWGVNEVHQYLFAVSVTGTLKAYRNGHLMAWRDGTSPMPVNRCHMYVGRSTEESDSVFRGIITDISAWDHEVEMPVPDSRSMLEQMRAVSQFSQWYVEDLAVWSFPTLAAYVKAVGEDPRFAADLLLRLDVHNEIDGYEDLVCMSLGPRGLALTLGGQEAASEGHGYQRRGDTVDKITVVCAELVAAEEIAHKPWVWCVMGPVMDLGERNCAEVRRPRSDGWHPGRRARRARRIRSGGVASPVH